MCTLWSYRASAMGGVLVLHAADVSLISARPNMVPQASPGKILEHRAKRHRALSTARCGSQTKIYTKKMKSI